MPHPEPEDERDNDNDGIEGEPSGHEHRRYKSPSIKCIQIEGREEQRLPERASKIIFTSTMVN
jgi:hypothetical protein